MKFYSSNETPLEERIERYISKCPCPNSERHIWIKETAAKLHSQFPELTSTRLAEILRSNLTRPEKHNGTECLRIAEWVTKQKGMAPQTHTTPQKKPVKFHFKASPVMVAQEGTGGEIEDMIKFIDHVFESSETVFLSGGLSHDKFQGKSWQVWDVVDLLSNHPDAEEMFGNHKDGLYIKVNPIKADWRVDESKVHRSAPTAQFERQDGTCGTDVADFRHCLVEFDTGTIKEQIAIIEHAGLPVKALCQSGSKSAHAIIAIDAENDFKLYQQRCALVVEAVNYSAKSLGHDSKIKVDKVQDAVRWTRFAGAIRKCDKKGNPLGKDGKGVQQKLLALFDAKWIEPEEIDEYADALMACAASPEKVYRDDIKEPMQIIEGFLRPGDVASLTAPSKVGKTWELIRMASSIANGGKWMGMQCQPHNVIYLNFELHDYDMHKRMRKLLKDNTRAQNRIIPFNLRGMKGDTETMLTKFEELVSKGSITASIIIIDPIYRFYGDADENSNTDITNLLLRIQKFASRTGMAVVFAHHHAKGKNRGDTMSSGEQQSGAGAFTRSYDANINLGRIPSDLKDIFDPEEYMLIQFDIRAFPRKPYLIAQWDEDDCEFKIIDQSEIDEMKEEAKEIAEEDKKHRRNEKRFQQKNSRKGDILNFIEKHSEVSKDEIATFLSLSKRSITPIIVELEAEGIIESHVVDHGKKVWKKVQ